jgi:DNA-binding CsgD family transcriptional regulator
VQPERDTGRDAYARKAWADAYAHLAAADRSQPLEPADLELLAASAYLTGRDVECVELWARSYSALLERGEPTRAARNAFWLSIHLMLRGQPGRSGGWLARAQRLVDARSDDCPERGYLLVPVTLSHLENEPSAALELARTATACGERFADADLCAFGLTLQGQALVALGRAGEGLARLDEAMVSVTSGEVSEMVAGILFCAVIETCRLTFDLRRVREWTSALTSWCSAQPDLVPYRGQCLVHRAEILTLHGAWDEALDETRRSCAAFGEASEQPALGAAYYQLGELHRLRGSSAEAESAYQQASRLSRQPQPGHALLRLAQGRTTAAAAAIRRAVDETRERGQRAELLIAQVEILLAVKDIPAARVAADELTAIAVALDAPLLLAASRYGDGAVRLAEGSTTAALVLLRSAWNAWQALEVPYETARVRVLIGLACRALGDEDSARMEFDAALWIFTELGAVPDVARVESLLLGPAGGLTAREIEVVRLVATGRTNRDIAAELYLSEKTVARHLSNIFAKLDMSSRSAVTAYAYEHGLLA